MEAIYLDGCREMLSQISDYNFNWHSVYIYADQAAPLLPKGTILHFLTWYLLSNAMRERGSSVTGAFEGCFYNADGSQSFLRH